MSLRVFARRALTFLIVALAFAGHAQLVRVPNTTLALPPAPPVYGFTSTNAFGTLTFTNVVNMTTPPGETNRLFVVGKNGTVWVITNLASPTRSVFMDISDRVMSTLSDSGSSGEQGLLGLAFHPGYTTNRYFFVFYTRTNGSGRDDVLARFQISAGNTNQGDASSEVMLIKQPDQQPNHNAGDIKFGPDGYLYVPLGDEGGGDDNQNNSQLIDKDFFSAVMRLDVDKRATNRLPNAHTSIVTPTNYFVPADNPFIGVTNFNGSTVNSNSVRTEFWAVGMRNPWRLNYDAASGLWYCGDVGQSAREEVDIIKRGNNYGWAFREGGIAGPKSASAPGGFTSTDPIIDYGHTNGGYGTRVCIIGGTVYRGDRLPQLTGCYLYADYGSGEIWALNYNGTAVTTNLFLFQDTGISSFGVDPRNGDILYADLQSASDSVIKRINYTTNFTGAPLPATLYDAGVFTNLLSLTGPQDALKPAPGILPYAINVPFWSDNAVKSRWFSVPDTNLTIAFNASANWTFPTGTVWIKHFNLQLTNGDPASEIRLETRLLVKNSSGVYGMTYRWGNSKTNATLVAASGLDENFTINDGGNLRTQAWHYPSQNECLACHTPSGGFGLGMRTEQMNCNFDFGAGATNEIFALSGAGYFSSPVTNNPNTLPALAAATNTSASLEFRSRSFLAANCSQCHQPAGPVSQANWDARITTPTALAGLINGALANNLGNASNFVIAPHLPVNSALLTRIATRGANSVQMPPLASSLVDATATNLITQWILSLTNSFWLGATPDPQTTTPGSAAVLSVTFVATGDFTNDVNLSVTGLPSGASGNFSPAVVNSSATNSTLTISTTGATPAGTYALTIIGIGGGVTNTDTFSLVIVSSITSPGTLLWTGGADTNWASALNWTNLSAGGYGPPTPANNLLFTNPAAVSSASAPNNFVDGNFIVGNVQFANNAANTSPNYHVTQINPGQTLVVTNGISVSTTLDSGAAQVVNAVVTGANGTLTLSNGVLAVAQGSGTDGAHQAVLDLSALGTFNASVSRIAVAVAGIPAQSGNGLQRCSGVLYLAKTNFISTASTGVTNGILIGWNDNQGNGNSSGVLNAANKTSALYLGQTNVILTDAIYTGTDKTLGCLLAFNPGGLNSPVAYFRGAGGANSRVSLWGIGDTSMKANSNQSASGTNDFSGGTVNALVGNLNIGVTQTGASSGNTGNGSGVLTFSAGTMDVNNLTNGWSVGTGTTAGSDVGTGIVNVNGTATLKVNNVLALALNTGTGTGVPSGALKVNGGAVFANTIIAGSGTSVITLNNATLVVTNTVGSSASRIGTFAATNSTIRLRLNGSAIGTNIFAVNLFAGGATTVSIDAVANVSGVTTFPLISYTGSSPANGNFAKGTLPNGFSANLVNNAAQKRIDLVVAPNASVTPRFNALALFGTSMVVGGTNGFPSANYYVLASTNLALHPTNWQRVQTNPFDGAGGFLFTNPLDPSAPQNFFRLQLP